MSGRSRTRNPERTRVRRQRAIWARKQQAHAAELATAMAAMAAAAAAYGPPTVDQFSYMMEEGFANHQAE